jgi:hypothetical protein
MLAILERRIANPAGNEPVFSTDGRSAMNHGTPQRQNPALQAARRMSMAKGFIYVVRTVQRNYQQSSWGVPIPVGDKLYFGPCKVAMRPRMQPRDYVFGVSPSPMLPRRIVYAAKINERMTFGEAYERFPSLHKIQVHVRPAHKIGFDFPDTVYEHIPGAIHDGGEWRSDFPTPDSDAFFVCAAAVPSLPCWLGEGGPAVEGEVLDFLRGCKVYGQSPLPLGRNSDATETAPVRHGALFKGLHLETDHPKSLLALLARTAAKIEPPSVASKRPSPGCRPDPRRTQLRRRRC